MRARPPLRWLAPRHAPRTLEARGETRSETRTPAADASTEDQDRADDASQRFWPWFAVGVLLFCWIAEATMCAERGF